MMAWRVSNLLNTSLSVEDLGITLQARGGTDSSVTISDESRYSSKSLRNLESAKWVSVTLLNVGAPKMPAWPFSKPSIPPSAPNPAPINSPSGALPPIPAIRPAPPDPAMFEVIKKLESTIAELAAAIRSTPPPSFHPSTTTMWPPPDGAMNPFPTTPSGEAVFMPSSILPKDAKAEIKVQVEEASADDVSDAADALKKMRRNR